MKIEKKDIIYLVIIIFIIILSVGIYNIPSPPNFNISKDRNKLDKILLKSKIKQDSLKEKIKEKQDKIYLLEYKISTTNKKINQINQEYAKKIDSINNFQSHNIKEYFTKRYSK